MAMLNENLLVCNDLGTVDVFNIITGKRMGTIPQIQKMSCSLKVHNSLIIGSQTGVVSMIQAGTLKITKQFNNRHWVSSLCQSDQFEVLSGQIDGFVTLSQISFSKIGAGEQTSFQTVGALNIIRRTSRGDFALGCGEGIFFARLEVDQQSSQKRLVQDKNEVFLKGHMINQLREYAHDLFIASDWNEPSYFLIDRNNKMVITIEETAATHKWCTDLKPMPGFDKERFPYYVARTRFTLTLIDLAKKKCFLLMQTKQNAYHPFEKLQILAVEGQKISFIYTALDYVNKMTYIDQVIVDWLFMRALREAANQTMQ